MPEPYIDPPDTVEGRECPDCEGSGMWLDETLFRRKCPTCNGEGEIFPDPFDEHCDEE